MHLIRLQSSLYGLIPPIIQLFKHEEKDRSLLKQNGI